MIMIKMDFDSVPIRKTCLSPARTDNNAYPQEAKQGRSAKLTSLTIRL